MLRNCGRLSYRTLFSSIHVKVKPPPPFRTYRDLSRNAVVPSTGVVSSSLGQLKLAYSSHIRVDGPLFSPSHPIHSTPITISLSDIAMHYGLCYWELSKARLSILVVATSGTGYVLGSGPSVDILGLVCTCTGTMLVAASANTLNQVFEISNDSMMKRTMNRPLPSGRISVEHALTWALTTAVLGTTLLTIKGNTLAASLAVSNLILYAFIYTPLKQLHPVNTWVGAVVGATPPLLGWVAACGEITVQSMILPMALYFWQIPHFMALAYMCRRDYAVGGFRMLTLSDSSGRRTASVALWNCLYLLPLGFLSHHSGLTSSIWFSLESSLLSLAITGTAFMFYRVRTFEAARTMFLASLLYLPLFMSGLLLHRLSREEEKEGEDDYSGVLFSLMSHQHHHQRRHRPPVAYASIAPFPFMPAPFL